VSGHAEALPAQKQCELQNVLGLFRPGREAQLVGENQKTVIFDLTEVRFLDSTGVGILMIDVPSQTNESGRSTASGA
jgi:hypothetical protein